MSSMSNESTRENIFCNILKERSLMGVGAVASFVGVGALGLLLM